MTTFFSQHLQHFKAVWVDTPGTIGRGVKKKNLAPEQIAVFAADDFCSKGDVTSLMSPSFKKHKRLQLFQGLYPTAGQNSPAITFQTKHARESVTFTKDDIVNWRGYKSDTFSTTDVVALGYDGLDASKTLSGLLDAKTMYVDLVLSGEPISRIFHTNRIVHRITIDKGFCGSDCECLDKCGKVKCDIIADRIVEEINNGYSFVMSEKGSMLKTQLSRFAKAYKIKKCEEELPTVDLTKELKYTITICDDGYTSFSQLQAANPDAKISLESQVNGKSTYSVWLPEDATAPEDFVLQNFTVPYCGDCPECPESTVIEGYKIVQVSVQCGATPPAVPGEISSTLYPGSLLVDTYLVKVDVATTDAEIEEALDTETCLEYSILGEEGKSCLVSKETYSWTQCEECFKTTKEYQIVLSDKDCAAGESRLTELQEAYPELVIEEILEGECRRVYKTTMNSNCVPEEQCGRLVEYKFEAPASYEGYMWEELKPIITEPSCETTETEEPCCVCGVIIEGAAIDFNNPGECEYGWYHYNSNDKKPVRIQISISSLDYSDNPCDVTDTFSTVLRKAKVSNAMTGFQLYDIERYFLEGYENKFWSQVPAVNNINNFRPHTRYEKVYDMYILTLKRPNRKVDTYVFNDYTNYMDYCFFIESGRNKPFENFMNELVLSTGNPDLKAVVL